MIRITTAPKANEARVAIGLRMVARVYAGICRAGCAAQTPDRAGTGLADGRRASLDSSSQITNATSKPPLATDEPITAGDAVTQARMRAALHGAELGTWEWDRATGSIAWSDAARSILDTPTVQVRERWDDWERRLHPTDAELIRAWLHEPAAPSGLFREEVRVRSGHEPWRWLCVAACVVSRDADGVASRLVGVVQDVTNRRRAELALETIIVGTTTPSRETLFQALAQRVAEAMPVRWALLGELIEGGRVRTLAHWDGDHWLPASEFALAGTPCEAAMGATPAFFEDDVQALFPGDAFAAAHGVRSYFGIPLYNRDEVAIGILAVMHDAPLSLSPEFEGVLHVFAARAAAEVERSKAERILRADQELFLTGPVVVWTWGDADAWQVRHVSANVSQFGYDPRDFLDGDRAYVDIVHVDDRDRFRADAARAVALGTQSLEREYRIVCPDGAVRWMYDLTRIARAPDGTVANVRGYTLDVTERRRAQESRAALESQLRQAQKLEAIGTLAGGVAHDFNNILAAIVAHVELVRDTTQDADVRSDLEAVMSACTRGRRLAGQILQFSRRQEQVRKTVDVVPLIDEVVALIRPTTPATVEIQSRLDSRTPAIVADPTEIHQVLLNLASNAVQSMADATGVLSLESRGLELPAPVVLPHRTLPAGRYAEIVVRDTGTGMDESTLARAFDPFFTTKPVGRGTGLGLSVVHGIVESHGGTITIDSVPGRGTSVTVLIPASATRASDRPRTTAPAAQGATERILFVEDEPMLISAGRRMLKRLGYEVSAFGDPREALAAFREAPASFDIVVTDQTMPGLTGVGLAREVTAIRADIPILLVTGLGALVEGADLRRTGIRKVLSKPFNSAEIAQALRDVLTA